MVSDARLGGAAKSGLPDRSDSPTDGHTASRAAADVLPCANVFLIGAQKAETTYLAALLGRSPDVCVTRHKEPHFFTTHFEEDGAGAHYAESFARPDARVRLDASTPRPPTASCAPSRSAACRTFPASTRPYPSVSATLGCARESATAC